MGKVPISICLVTRNEEEMIERCLKSVYGWADEIIVVDGKSKDNTVKICKKYGAKVFIRENDPSHHVNKFFTFNEAKNPWVFSLDADEELTEELKKEIEHTIKNDNGEFNAYYIKRINLVNDKPLKYDWPGVQLRFYRKGQVYFEGKRLHEYIKVRGKIGKLKMPFLHYGFWRGLHYYFYKQNNYTTFDIQKMVELGEKYTFPMLIKNWINITMYMFRHKIVFNEVYGPIFLMTDYMWQWMLYIKFREFSHLKNKSHYNEVNKY